MNNLKDPLPLIHFALYDNSQSISHKTRRLSSKSLVNNAIILKDLGVWKNHQVLLTYVNGTVYLKV